MNRLKKIATLIFTLTILCTTIFSLTGCDANIAARVASEQKNSSEKNYDAKNNLKNKKENFSASNNDDSSDDEKNFLDDENKNSKGDSESVEWDQYGGMDPASEEEVDEVLAKYSSMGFRSTGKHTFKEFLMNNEFYLDKIKSGSRISNLSEKDFSYDVYEYYVRNGSLPFAFCDKDGCILTKPWYEVDSIDFLKNAVATFEVNDNNWKEYIDVSIQAGDEFPFDQKIILTLKDGYESENYPITFSYQNYEVIAVNEGEWKITRKLESEETKDSFSTSSDGKQYCEIRWDTAQGECAVHNFKGSVKKVSVDVSHLNNKWQKSPDGKRYLIFHLPSEDKGVNEKGNHTYVQGGDYVITEDFKVGRMVNGAPEIREQHENKDLREAAIALKTFMGI